MFTGIIRHVGTVILARPASTGRRLMIDLGPLAEGLVPGDSVAVNGACLTVAAIDGTTVGFDAVAETLECTNIGRLKTGSRVNLERALRLGDRLDGHMVQGHVDGQAVVERIDRSAGQWVVHLACGRELTDQMVAKGSVAIDGVSLTLAGLSDGRFSVSLIPTTLVETTFPDLRPGDSVNIETDVLGKYVRRALGGDAPAQGGVSLEKLRQAGFD